MNAINPINPGLEQVEAGKYEYPYEVYKVPVQADLLYHLVVPATLIGAVHRIDQDHDVKAYAGEYVAAMETGNRKEVIEEIMRGLLPGSQVIGCQLLAGHFAEEMGQAGHRGCRIGKSAP